MPKKTTRSQHTEIVSKSKPHFLIDIDILNEALKSLYALRKSSKLNRWDDYEQEAENEDFGFKNAEALHAVLLPLGSRLKGIDDYSHKKEIQKDLDALLSRCLKKEKGKIKLDYSPGLLLSPETKDSLVDFAATTLRLYLLAKKVGCSEKNAEKVDELITETTKALLHGALQREVGTAWPGVLIPEEQSNHHRPDTFFTVSAMLALYDVACSEASPLTKQIKDQCRDIIVKAAYWLEKRFNDSSVASDDEGGVSSIVYFTYALTAFLTCWDLLDEERHKTCSKMAKAYLKLLRNEKISAPKLHHPIVVSDNRATLSYEDRSSLGSVLTVLSLMKHRMGNDPEFDQADFSEQMANIYSQVLADRDASAGLWSGARVTIYASYRAIEGVVQHALYTRAVPSILSEREIVDAVLEVLNSGKVREAIVANLMKRADELSAKEIEKVLEEKK
ncbi:MAG: hypothetical protein AB1306_06015 [Nitrospirota bacterium]